MAHPAEILFEFHRIGNVIKVSAVDPISNTEVSLVGAAGASQHALKMAALRKLQYVLEKNQKKMESEKIR